MAKQFLVILMIVNVCFLSFQEAGYYLLFKMNQDFIAQNWCINRNVEEVMCSGKCYLEKVVKENQEKQNSEQSTIPQFDQEESRYLAVFPSSSLAIITTSTTNLYYTPIYSNSLWQSAIFRPPIG